MNTFFTKVKLGSSMDSPCCQVNLCISENNNEDITVHYCPGNGDDGCWEYVCDDCAFATTSGEMVCPSCWEKKHKPKNLECSSCNGTGESFISPLDPSDWRKGLAPGLPLQEGVDREGHYETCFQCKGTGLDTEN